VHFAKDAPPLRIDPNGRRYPSGHIYVQFVRLERSSDCRSSSSTAGPSREQCGNNARRPSGLAALFLEKGHDTYLSDAVGRDGPAFPLSGDLPGRADVPSHRRNVPASSYRIDRRSGGAFRISGHANFRFLTLTRS